jgi:FkbM family methyltransferase
MVVFPRLKGARGQMIRVDLEAPGQIDVFDELFIDRIYDLGAVAFAPELVVDCGAFCGYFSAMASGYFPGARLACFEANPRNFPALHAQLELLNTKVEANEAAVFVREGTVAFSGNDIGGSIAATEGSGTDLLVPCIDFPAWLSARAPASLVWKLDIEGAELEVLPKTLAFLPRRTVCFLETHHGDPVCETLLQPYRLAGFSVTEVRRRASGVGDFSYIEWLLIRND